MPGPTKAGAASRAPAPGKTKRRDKAAPDSPPPIDAETVAELAALGCTRGEAAAWFGVPLAELGERLREPALKDAWTRGKARGRVFVRRTQFRLAEKSAPMAQHLGRTVLGQDAPARAPARKKPTRIVIDTGIDRG